MPLIIFIRAAREPTHSHGCGPSTKFWTPMCSAYLDVNHESSCSVFIISHVL